MLFVCLGFADVACDDYYVPGGLVSIFHRMSLGIIWWPQDYTGSYGYHCSTLCQVLHLLQPLHLCHCKQKVCLFIMHGFTHFTPYAHLYAKNDSINKYSMFSQVPPSHHWDDQMSNKAANHHQHWNAHDSFSANSHPLRSEIVFNHIYGPWEQHY